MVFSLKFEFNNYGLKRVSKQERFLNKAEWQKEAQGATKSTNEKAFSLPIKVTKSPRKLLRGL